MKKSMILIILSVLISSCNNNTISKSVIKIDLNQDGDSIFYSVFAEELNYIELNTNDTCVLSDIERIYLDDDTIIVLDKNGAGVLVFTNEGNLVKHIDYYGQGPKEFVDITAATIDPELNHICIWDYATQKINKYSYKGDFVKSYKSELFVRDFAVLKGEMNLCILPFYSRILPSGIWTSDTNNVIIKKIDTNVPKDDQIEFSGSFYNLKDQLLYYYDRNKDDFSCVTKDTFSIVYHFDVKQRLSEELRKKDPTTLMPFKNIAYMSNFSDSYRHLLLTYYCYGEVDQYKWVLLDKESGKVSVSPHLYNDIDYVETDYHHVYYLNDSTWCRIIETEANNCNTILQFIKLK